MFQNYWKIYQNVRFGIYYLVPRLKMEAHLNKDKKKNKNKLTCTNLIFEFYLVVGFLRLRAINCNPENNMSFYSSVFLNKEVFQFVSEKTVSFLKRKVTSGPRPSPLNPSTKGSSLRCGGSTLFF